MRLIASIFACLLLLGSAETKSSVEIRFCPAEEARTYPLDSSQRVQGLLLPTVAVVNTVAMPFTLTAIHLELLKDGHVVDARTLDSAQVTRFADNGPGIQGVIRQAPFQFCGTDLIASAVKLAGPVLHQNEGIVFLQQVFAFDGIRDVLRVRAQGSSAGQPMEVRATLPIRSEFSKNTYLFPLRGVSYVGWGPSFHTGHRWVSPQAFALDIARLGGEGSTYRDSGTRFEDYYAYGTEVLAAAAGRVVGAVNDQAEDRASMQRPGESAEAYGTRSRQNQAARLKSANAITGNYVMIEHGNREYSLYAHLKPGSVRVRVGDRVAAGEILGELGSSGNSTEPHLHFHVCDKPDPLMCAGIPVNFSNITVLWADAARPLQSGDIVVAH